MVASIWWKISLSILENPKIIQILPTALGMTSKFDGLLRDYFHEIIRILQYFLDTDSVSFRLNNDNNTSVSKKHTEY